MAENHIFLLMSGDIRNKIYEEPLGFLDPSYNGEDERARS
jgi:hypothetical protein